MCRARERTGATARGRSLGRMRRPANASRRRSRRGIGWRCLFQWVGCFVAALRGRPSNQVRSRRASFSTRAGAGDAIRAYHRQPARIRRAETRPFRAAEGEWKRWSGRPLDLQGSDRGVFRTSLGVQPKRRRKGIGCSVDPPVGVANNKAPAWSSVQMPSSIRSRSCPVGVRIGIQYTECLPRRAWHVRSVLPGQLLASLGFKRQASQRKLTMFTCWS
jgi:hypothetical protein